MQSRMLGSSSITTSVLAYGCWRLAGSEGSESRTPEQWRHGIAAVHAAVEAGFTLFDLADIYGGNECERIFGGALKASPGLRDGIRIATKCGIRRAGDPDADAPYRYDFSPEHIERSVEGSLHRMGIESIDLLMLHRPDHLMHPAEVAGVFSRLNASGKVREFGVSNFTPDQVALLQKACPMKLVVHQVEISLNQLRAFEDGTLHQCLLEGITPMAWSPLDKGRLPLAGVTGPSSGVVTELARLGKQHGVEPAAVALSWLLRHPAGIVPVIGTTSPERIRAAAKAAAISLSREEWYRLMERARGSRLP